MHRIHMLRIDPRYWVAITFASIFGTNLGDLYAHELHLGIYLGTSILAVLAVAVFLIERTNRSATELFYWLVIIIIRTGATNIADYLAFRVRVDPTVLTLGLLAMLALFGWLSVRSVPAHDPERAETTLPDTGSAYWIAMLAAGVFGTVLGDICSHVFGEGYASVALDVVLAAALFARYSLPAHAYGLYWVAVGAARTAGTAMGDWFAENEVLNIGLPIATLITGCCFVLVLVAWRSRKAVGQGLVQST